MAIAISNINILIIKSASASISKYIKNTNAINTIKYKSDALLRLILLELLVLEIQL